MGDFISEYLEYNKYFESPTSFWKWSAYAIIAAILKDSVFKQEKDDRIHPNIYVLLLADSAVQRKDRPVNAVERFTRTVGNTKVIAGRSSIQALLDELASAETNPKTGRMFAGGQAIFIAPELSAGIVQDPQSVDILTDIYKSRSSPGNDVFESRLRGTGKFKIKNLCLSMMAATNNAMISGAYDSRAMSGGLLGRTLLVCPDEFRPGNSLWEVKETGVSFDSLVAMLVKIAQVKGEMEFPKETQEVFDSWYLPFRESYRERSDNSGIAGRIHTSVIKLSMILCTNATCGLTVRPLDMERAIQECLALIPNYQHLATVVAKTPIGAVHAIVLNDLVTRPDYCVTRKVLLQSNIMTIDSESLDKSASTLEQAGLLMQLVSGSGISYKLTEKGISEFVKKV